MLQRRKILISFLAITVLQGITYPAIALGSESNAMQVSSNSQTAEPNQNSNSIQGGDPIQSLQTLMMPRNFLIRHPNQHNRTV